MIEIICYICGEDKKINKLGRSAAGNKMYICKTCGKTFSPQARAYKQRVEMIKKRNAANAKKDKLWGEAEKYLARNILPCTSELTWG